ncbi:hypothetical protein [Methylorubrum populi]|uniref:Uncharacterized protein n=1 Tax=Methylorubrum populi TaxID=223967 RepID=A0A833J5Z3_9HYPH|nr:hypothetical protein [Methylorubrum populi]KAB7783916.1 hypothetical protein F8B43_3839 [Methylorubrum populi]
MPRPNRLPDRGAEPNGKCKVMVYVPPEVHRAMRQAALDDGDRFVSDVYVEAARAFLASRRLTIEVEVPADGAGASERASAVADLVAAVEGLVRPSRKRWSAAQALEPVDRQPAGTRAAEAMRTVLEVLREAGSRGLGHRAVGRGAGSWRQIGG